MTRAINSMGESSIPQRRRVMLFLLAPLLAAGCAAPPSVPPDGELRRIASLYVERALRYPENPAVRAEAMEAASEVLGDEARLLIREGLDDEHPGVRFAACMALGELKDTGAMADVRPLVEDPDPSVRVGAYFALEQMGDPSYRESWRDLLRWHEDPAVRRNAAMALGRLDNKSVMPLLRGVANSDRDEGVILQAMEGLALLGDRTAIATFIRDAYGGIGFRQPFALLTLGRVNNAEAPVVLRARLENAPYLEARLAAARGLALQGYAEGYDVAVAALDWDDANPDLPDDPPATQIMRVRSMAAMALGDIGDRRALGPLKTCMETMQDPRVQLAAATAILKILNSTPLGPIAE